jgi:hypothetical protein
VFCRSVPTLYNWKPRSSRGEEANKQLVREGPADRENFECAVATSSLCRTVIVVTICIQ